MGLGVAVVVARIMLVTACQTVEDGRGSRPLSELVTLLLVVLG